MPRTLLSMILFAVLTATAVAQDDALKERTGALLGRMGEKRTPEETVVYRDEILAWGDSLAAAGELALATQCDERAGILTYLAGDFAEAVGIWEAGLDRARRSGDPRRIGALLNAQASGISAMGDNERAAALFTELVDFRREHGDVRGEGTSLSNLAFSQVALFRFPAAIATLRAAVVAHREAGNHAGLAHSQITLSELLAHAGRHEEGLALADSAVANARVGGDPRQLAPALHVRALRHFTQGALDESLADFDECLALLEDHSLQTMIGGTRINRADVLISLGRPAEAVEEIRGALPMVDADMNPGQAVVARGNLGRALLRDGRPDEARPILSAGIQRFHALQDSLTDAVQRADANIVAVPSSVLALLEIESGNHEEAWRVVESGLARQLRRSITGSDASVDAAAFRARLAELDARALVFGVAGAEGCPVLLVGPDGIDGGSLTMDAGLRRDLAGAADLVATDAATEATFTRVAVKLAAAVPGLFESPRRRLIIMPGGLGGFPFELLPAGDGTTLDDRFIVSYAPSASVLASLEDRSATAGGFLALADPTPDRAGGDSYAMLALRRGGDAWPPLPEARAEVRTIAPRGAQLLFGDEATRTALFDRGAGAAVIHLATHAAVDRQNPHASALMLAGGADDVTGVTTAADIAAASLAADLVSLSGCSTVGGYRVLGEGTFGLVRSFLEAGARTVVASRWDVEDAAAREFMTAFYGNLAAGTPRDEALAAARRELRGRGFARRDYAAFALVGAVGGELPALRGAGFPAPLPWAAGGLVAILAAAAVRRRRST